MPITTKHTDIIGIYVRKVAYCTVTRRILNTENAHIVYRHKQHKLLYRHIALRYFYIIIRNSEIIMLIHVSAAYV